MAYFWCKQSDAGCFDTHGFEPLFFSQKKKPVLPLVLPFLFITAITLTVLILKIQAFWGTNKPLAIISIVLFVFVLWMVAEGCVAFKQGKKHKNSETNY